jgi:hypothetical protein
MNGKIMKKPGRSSGRRKREDELTREYRFDYSKSQPNRVARRVSRDAVVVVLDPDAAQIFTDPRQVNALLRATIAAVETGRSRRAG